MFFLQITENDVERLKRRIDSLVKANDDKEKKIEELQQQLAKYQPPVTNTSSVKKGYEADGDNSDSNSLPSVSSEKESRASSAEPMITREISTPVRDKQRTSTRTLPSDERAHSLDQSGYISDGPSHKYSLYKKSSGTNLDKTKSSSAKGIKSIFGKIIRTNSGSFRDDNSDQSPFQRGGLRATTGGRTAFKPLNDLETTFSRWPTEQVVNWLYGIGLGQYANECRKCVKNGLQLLQATPQELEKDIGMRNPLHRKKLQLCLNGLCARKVEADYINLLDTHWVQKWLDDIGLPQYKDYFAESKVDGRLLHNLTLEDLMYLNITNELHHLSIKRAIQVLRLNGFNPSCLKRRPANDDKNDMAEVMHWTNHRVMEWLRSIDLSEYAPNLRGSGVHGGLIVLESRFNSTILAEILSIPLSKTLLRRHLNMRFLELIGAEIQHRKHEYEKSTSYQPLTSHTKIKFSRGLFSHRRTKSVEADDLVCPINENGISPSLKLVLAHDSPTTVV
ncbi:unnamed protein product [Didymodactylos carnosus]|uniref:SAM domain-containing protein n=1 Tax=Didymodactylos carnosus TaxID=1234261 RepID=A0A815DFZ3_9BILA|nr:unnamed protein product [Didymodactylos carnosus]CAF4123122.1 unnamed protein product [Didymodactylos carnosus]